jgi:predicted enzyme related to lactoylglutathione lyase
MIRHPSLFMANIAFFQIPADNIDRAKHFYRSLLGWKIAPTRTPMDPAMQASVQYQDIITGDTKEGSMNMGLLYRRQQTEPIINFVTVDNLDRILANVEKLGGKIVRPKEEIKTVGLVAIIQDSEGNLIGLWEPE